MKALVMLVPFRARLVEKDATLVSPPELDESSLTDISA